MFKLIFGNKTDNELTPDDIKNIKSLLLILNMIVDVLSSKNGISIDLIIKFKINQQGISRLLKINGLAVYFKRHITVNELKSLLRIMELSDEILRIYGNNEQTTILHKLIHAITRDNTRWIKKSS
jgi:hypothetical protein